MKRILVLLFMAAFPGFFLRMHRGIPLIPGPAAHDTCTDADCNNDETHTTSATADADTCYQGNDAFGI